MKKISIGVPCYNEEENVLITYKTLKKLLLELKKYDHELILVDNGSLDNTRKLIKQIAKKDKKVKGIFLSRNFGPEASGQAAFDNSTGDAIIGIPADLQEPPEMILKFIKKWEFGYDIVLGTYTNNSDNFIMKSVRKLYYLIQRKMSFIDFPMDSTGFGLFDKKVLLAMRKLPEKYRFGRGILAWVGFKKAFIPYVRKKRDHGKSSYNFFDYVKHAERGIFGFSYLLLDLMVYGGIAIVFFSFLFIVGYLYTVLVVGNPIKASIPTMLAIVFFGGVQLLAISIIGKYIQVIVEETKNRPIYIVEETINIKEPLIEYP
jgi:polyisoprenyl-phosphate glycosyltransferase